MNFKSPFTRATTVAEFQRPATSASPFNPAEAPPIPDHELLKRIGQGSYGDVWLARNIVGTYRAIKIVYRANFADERPFQREFSGMQKFEPISRSNEGLMQILQIGQNDQEGFFYYVMELADDGGSDISEAPAPGRGSSGVGGKIADPAAYLPKTLYSEKARHGKLPATECLRLGVSLTLALDYLHRNLTE